MTELLETAVVDRDELEARMATHRRELTGYCYRMLGSSYDAEDAVQDTMVRAWRSLDKLQGPAALRSWLYRIATNVCLDLLDGRKRRALPVDMSDEPFAPVEASLSETLPHGAWVEPALTGSLLGGDPAGVAAQRDSVRLAFAAALQVLPPRQRAVLVDTSVAAVNSALQRARATLAAHDGKARPGEVDADQAELLAAYVDAFQRYDMAAFVRLLNDDAVQDMPPFAMWLRSADERRRLDGGSGVGVPLAIQALEVHDGRISRITSFLDTDLFDLFGPPATHRRGCRPAGLRCASSAAATASTWPRSPPGTASMATTASRLRVSVPVLSSARCPSR